MSYKLLQKTLQKKKQYHYSQNPTIFKYATQFLFFILNVFRHQHFNYYKFISIHTPEYDTN